MPFGVRWPFRRERDASATPVGGDAAQEAHAEAARTHEADPGTDASLLSRTVDSVSAASMAVAPPTPLPRDDSPAEPDPGLRSAVIERTSDQGAMVRPAAGAQSTLVSVPETNRVVERIQNRGLYQDLQGATMLHRNEQSAHFVDGLQSLLSFRQADEMDVGGPFSGVFRLLAPEPEAADEGDEPQSFSPFASRKTKAPDKPAPRRATDVRVGRSVVDPALEMRDGRWSDRAAPAPVAAVAVQRRSDSLPITPASTRTPDVATAGALQRATAPTRPIPVVRNEALPATDSPEADALQRATTPRPLASPLPTAAEEPESPSPEFAQPPTASAPATYQPPAASAPARGPASKIDSTASRPEVTPHNATPETEAAIPLVVAPQSVAHEAGAVPGPAAGPVVFRSTATGTPSAPYDAGQQTLAEATAPATAQTSRVEPRAPFVARSVPVGTPDVPPPSVTPAQQPDAPTGNSANRVLRTPATDTPSAASTSPIHQQANDISSERGFDGTSSPARDGTTERAGPVSSVVHQPVTGPMPPQAPGVSPLEGTTAGAALPPAEMPFAPVAGAPSETEVADSSTSPVDQQANDISSERGFDGTSGPARDGTPERAGPVSSVVHQPMTGRMPPQAPGVSPLEGTAAGAALPPAEMPFAPVAGAPSETEVADSSTLISRATALDGGRATSPAQPPTSGHTEMPTAETATESAPPRSIDSEGARITPTAIHHHASAPAETEPTAAVSPSESAPMDSQYAPLPFDLRAPGGDAPGESSGDSIPDVLARATAMPEASPEVTPTAPQAGGTTPDLARAADASPMSATVPPVTPAVPAPSPDSAYTPLEMGLAASVPGSDEPDASETSTLQRASTTVDRGREPDYSTGKAESAAAPGAASSASPGPSAASIGRTPSAAVGSTASTQIPGSTATGYSPVALDLATANTRSTADRLAAGSSPAGRPSFISRLFDRVTGRSPGALPHAQAPGGQGHGPRATEAASMSAVPPSEPSPVAAIAPITAPAPETFDPLTFAGDIGARSEIARLAEAGEAEPGRTQSAREDSAQPLSGTGTSSLLPHEPVTPLQTGAAPLAALPFAQAVGTSSEATAAAANTSAVLRSAAVDASATGGAAPPSGRARPVATPRADSTPTVPVTAPPSTTPLGTNTALPFAQAGGTSHPPASGPETTARPSAILRPVAGPQGAPQPDSVGLPLATPAPVIAHDLIAAEMSGPSDAGDLRLASGIPLISRFTESDLPETFDAAMPLAGNVLVGGADQPTAATGMLVTPHEAEHGGRSGAPSPVPGPASLAQRSPSIEQPAERMVVTPHQAQQSGHGPAAPPAGQSALMQRATEAGRNRAPDHTIPGIEMGRGSNIGRGLTMLSQQPAIIGPGMPFFPASGSPNEGEVLQRATESQPASRSAASMPLVSPVQPSISRETAGQEVQRTSQPEALAEIHRATDEETASHDEEHEMLPHELDILTEHIWQRVRRKLRIERERSRGWI